MNLPLNQYIPGTCNIGGRELAKRKTERIVGIILTLLFTVLSFSFYSSLLFWILLFASSGFTAVMHLQVRNRFCVSFGWFKKYNFGKPGSSQKINDPGDIHRDRKKVIVILIQSLLIACMYTGLAYLLKYSLF